MRYMTGKISQILIFHVILFQDVFARSNPVKANYMNGNIFENLFPVGYGITWPGKLVREYIWKLFCEDGTPRWCNISRDDCARPNKEQAPTSFAILSLQSANSDLPLPHGLAPSETMVWDHRPNPPLSAVNPMKKGFSVSGAPFFWIWSCRPRAQGVEVNPCMFADSNIARLKKYRCWASHSPRKITQNPYLGSQEWSLETLTSLNSEVRPLLCLFFPAVPRRRANSRCEPLEH